MAHATTVSCPICCWCEIYNLPTANAQVFKMRYFFTFFHRLKRDVGLFLLKHSSAFTIREKGYLKNKNYYLFLLIHFFPDRRIVERLLPSAAGTVTVYSCPNDNSSFVRAKFNRQVDDRTADSKRTRTKCGRKKNLFRRIDSACMKKKIIIISIKPFN